MGIYERIVCAVDFSHYSKATCLRAIEVARHFGAHLTLLNVVEYFPENRSNEVIAPENIDPAVYHEGEARKGLIELTRCLQYEDADIQVLFSSHSAWHEIVRFAGEQKMGLIVIGSHGKRGITALLGSTANGVVNHAPCDVFVARFQGRE
jgi:universal stress protein A